jgi:hypothetical protein
LFAMSGSVSAGLAAAIFPPVNVPVFGVEVSTPPNVSINGEISANDVLVSWGSDNAKFRVLEEDPDPLFNTQGLIKAAFTFVVEAGIPGVPTIELYKKILSERVLFDLYSGELSNPKNPFIPPPTVEDPLVNVKIDLTRPKKEWNWPVHVKWAGNDGQPDSIEVVVDRGWAEVRLNGVLLERHRHDKTGTFWIKGTEDDDSLVVEGELNRELTFEAGLGVNSLTLDDRDFGGNMSMAYDVSQVIMKRRATDTLGLLVIGEIPIHHSQTTHLNLLTTGFQGASVSIADLYNNEVNVALGRYENSVTIDTTFGGWADQVTLTSPLDLGLPFRPKGPTRLVVKDRTEADNFLHGRGRYVVTDERLTRQKFMPLDPDNPLLSDGGTGVTTIDYSEIDVVDFTLLGGDRGNNIDLQSTSLAGAFKLNGGAGDDTFTIGQVHATLPGAIGLERRQIGFATVDMTINGGGGLADKLILDDTGSDFLPYKVTSTYEVWNNFVGLVSVQDFGTTSNTVSGRFFFNFIEDVTLKIGGDNTVNVRDTVSAPDLFVDRGQTSIVGGKHTDIINVLRTTGGLTVDGGGGSNFITIGAVHNDTGSLDLINGDVRLTGQTPGALNFVTIMDKLNDLQLQYFLDNTIFERSGGGDSAKYVVFDGMSIFALAIRCGDGGNTFRIHGTPPPDPTFGTQIDIHTGDNDDFVTVRGTRGPVSLDLGPGFYQTLSFGSADLSLDAIQGDFTVSGGGFIDAFISNQFDMVSRYISIDANFVSGQFLERYTVDGEQVYYSNRFLFPVAGELRLQYTGGQGGDTVFIAAVPANASVLAYGSPGVRDTFALGFAGDTNRILGPVYISGQAEDGDFAYYYEFLNPNPQTHTLSTDSFSGAMLVQRPAVADVRYHGLQQVIFYAPYVGGNTVNVQGVPAGTILNMAVGNGDAVNLGAPTAPTCLCVDAPLPERTLAGILGPVQVGSYANPDGTLAAVSLTIDDSGNTDPTPRRAELSVSPAPLNYYEALTGLAPAPIYWNLGPSSSVAIRGGAADATFALLSTAFVTPISIDGGGGINTLDYADADTTGLVSWYKADGNANDAVGSMHGVAKNGAAFDTGHLGQAFSFDGVDDFIEIADSPHHTPNSISLDAWVKPDTVAGAHFIVTKYDSSEPNNKSWALGVIDGRVRFGVYQGNAARAIDTDMPVLTAGVWQHVAGIFDVATQTIKIYVNGEEIPSSFVPGGHASTLTAITDSSSPVRIGSIVNVNGEMVFFWDGLIDDIGIFNRALTAAEVQARFLGDVQLPVGTGVYVNLPTGDASGLAGGIANFQNIVGSAGNDILVGNGGNVLDGRGGRDLLIAGNAASVLLGGGGEDLLIAGTTAYDLDSSALAAIHAEWRRTDIDYATRVANLTTDNGAPLPKLIADDTVESNGGSNTLSGDDVTTDDNALDLFFASFDLDFYDSEEGEWLIAI